MLIGNSNIRLKESLRAKVFSLFTFFIVIISVSFTIFFIRHESKNYQEQLVNEGRLLAGLLADNARLPVFAENREALETAADGITRNDNVTAVAIFAANNDLLAEAGKDRSGRDPGLDKAAEKTKI